MKIKHKLIKTITIPKTKGDRVIADSKLFSYIDSDFKKWGADKPEGRTSAVKADVFEMTKDATFSEMFGTGPFLTQDQILWFVENKKDLLANDWYTFFPFKSGDEFFVAYVCVSSDGSLEAYVGRLSYDHVWHAEYRYRFVVPQLDSETPLEIDPLALMHSDALQKAIDLVKAEGYVIYKLM